MSVQKFHRVTSHPHDYHDSSKRKIAHLAEGEQSDVSAHESEHESDEELTAYVAKVIKDFRVSKAKHALKSCEQSRHSSIYLIDKARVSFGRRLACRNSAAWPGRGTCGQQPITVQR